MKILNKTNKILLLLTVLLFILGLIMVFSSSNVTAYMQYHTTPYHYFINELIFLFVGLVAYLIMIRFNTKVYGVFSFGLMILLIISLIVLFFLGKAKNQAISWYDFGFVSFQPSEFAKIVTIVWLSYYYGEHKDNLNDLKTLFFPLIPCIIITALIFFQPDLGTAIIYASIVGVIFFAQPFKKSIKMKIMLGILGLAVIGLLLISTTGLKVLAERQSDRFNISNPCDRLLTNGNQICNGYIAMNNGGLWGKGLGNSTQKYLYLPEPYTDFIFCVMVEELGAVFSIVVLLVYILILYTILLIGKRSINNRGSSMCYGVFVYILLHITVNLLGIMGLIPMTGVPLPFISYGGSFTLCLVLALTLVQRVNVERNLQKIK